MLSVNQVVKMVYIKSNALHLQCVLDCLIFGVSSSDAILNQSEEERKQLNSSRKIKRQNWQIK